MKFYSLKRIRSFLVFLFFCFATQAIASLPPSIAFRPAVSVTDAQTLEARFFIAEGHYLYKDKFVFSVEPQSIQLGTIVFPKGEMVEDENFGKVEVYYREVTIRLPIKRAAGNSLPIILNITSQGCSKAGLCYPIQNHSFKLELSELKQEELKAPPPADESGRIAQILEEQTLPWIIVSFFGFGLLLSFTPCVFPMFPILSSIIVGAGKDGHGITHSKGFLLSIAYVLGMAITYTVIGIIAGLTGTLLSAVFQTPQFLYGSALLLIALAFSMFGYYEFQFSASLQNFLSVKTSKLKGGSLPAVMLMGMFSTILTGACVAAPLAGSLVYIGKTGDALLGGVALFSMAIGMGIPLLVIGASAGALLPRSGDWMNVVKKIFGYVLLATAIWIITPVIPPVVMMWLYAFLLIMIAVQLRTIDPLPPETAFIPRIGKAIGVIFMLSGVAILVGALSGSHDPLKPLAVLQAGAKENRAKPIEFEMVRSVAELDEKVKTAGRPVMLDFYAETCKSCKEMEKYTFTDPRVQKKIDGWLVLKADVTANSTDDQALLSRFGLYGTPGIIFFDAQGNEIKDVRVVGYQNSNEFLGTLNRAIPD